VRVSLAFILHTGTKHHPSFQISCLLLRISRKKGNELGPPKVSVSKVSRHYKFSAPSDYQYLPVDPLGHTRSNLAPNLNPSELSGRQEELLLIPPIFSRPDSLHDYAFKPCKVQQPRVPSPPPFRDPATERIEPPPAAIPMQIDDAPYDILED
jgi:hypothetical protein